MDTSANVPGFVDLGNYEPDDDSGGGMETLVVLGGEEDEPTRAPSRHPRSRHPRPPKVKLGDKYVVEGIFYDGAYTADRLLLNSQTSSGMMLMYVKPFDGDYKKAAEKPVVELYKGLHEPLDAHGAGRRADAGPGQGQIVLGVELEDVGECQNMIKAFVRRLEKNCGVIQIVDYEPTLMRNTFPGTSVDRFWLVPNEPGSCGFEIDSVVGVGAIPAEYVDGGYGGVGIGKSYEVLRSVYDGGRDPWSGNRRGVGGLTLFLDEIERGPQKKQVRRLDAQIDRGMGDGNVTKLAKGIHGKTLSLLRNPDVSPYNNRHKLGLRDMRVHVRRQFQPKNRRTCRK
jgi:hypothetical protein